MRQPSGTRIAFPPAGKGVKTLVVIHVATWVLYLVLLRMGVDWAASELALVPRDFLTRGRLWQPVTSVLIHAPTGVGHLLFNMLFLWWFGGPIESWWGTKGLYRTYALCAAGGVAVTVLAGLLVLPLGPGSSLYGMWTGGHLGASGATLGLTIAWGSVLWRQKLNFFLLGEMEARTFVLILVGIQLLTALSFDSTSSTSHFGGIIMGFLVGRGYWATWKKKLRPAWLKNRMTQAKVERKRRQKERAKARFEVIEGGLEDDRDTAGKPIWGKGDDDDPVVH